MRNRKISEARQEIGYLDLELTEQVEQPNPERRYGLDLRAMAEEGYYSCSSDHSLPATESGYPGAQCPFHAGEQGRLQFVEPLFYREPRTTLAMLRAVL